MLRHKLFFYFYLPKSEVKKTPKKTPTTAMWHSKQLLLRKTQCPWSQSQARTGLEGCWQTAGDTVGPLTDLWQLHPAFKQGFQTMTCSCLIHLFFLFLFPERKNDLKNLRTDSCGRLIMPRARLFAVALCTHLPAPSLGSGHAPFRNQGPWTGSI